MTNHIRTKKALTARRSFRRPADHRGLLLFGNLLQTRTYPLRLAEEFVRKYGDSLP